MSLFDQMKQQLKQNLGDAAVTARDVGQNLGARAAAQLALKKLQIEANRKTHELGARVYEWHRSGTLVATGTVPREVSDLCHALDDIHQKTRDEEARLEAAKREAELRAAQNKATPTIAPSITVTETVITQTPPAPDAPQGKITAPLTPLAAPTTEEPTNSSRHINSFSATAIGPTAIGPSIPGPAMPGLPPMPAPGSNPDLPSRGIPVPGGDLPSMPAIPSNPDLPPTSPNFPSSPSSPDVGPTPTIPGQPL